MKRLLHFIVKGNFAGIIPGLFALIILGAVNTQAQVSFTQTLNADFYKGNYNDLIVSGDNISLPNQATDVNTWLTTTILPQTLEGHKAATWNNRYVYVVGGYNDVTYSNAVYRATLQSGGISNWTTLNPMPVGLRDHAVVIGTNTIYVIGGRDASNIYSTIYYADIYTDGSIGDWQTSTVSLPLGLWGHQAAYCNGYIYVSGGTNTTASTAANSFVFYAKVLADNTLSAFSPTTILPASRNGHSMVASGDKLYVLGGFANGGAKANTVYYATSGNGGTLGAWASATALPVTISNHSSLIQNGLITVLAGESGGTLVNTVYYADINASPLVWNLSTNVLYDHTKDGAAFATNGWIGYCGGENLSGTPIHNSRYANLTLSTDYEKSGFFVSNPFYELGAERLITELTFAASNPAGTNTQIAYRTSGEDFIWDNWTALTATSPITVGLIDRYLQYKVIFTGDGLVTPTLLEMNLWTPGTELAGNLNGITLFDAASSPYWVTADITFTSGTHTFDAGVELNFLPETGLSVSQANVICNGTVSDSVKFIGYTSEIGTWDGIYFDPNSDNGVSSQLYYTVIQGAGFGSWNANLYCNSTNEPLLMHCNLRDADGHGLRLNSAHLSIEESFFDSNTESGVYLENSNPSFVNCETYDNQFAGLYLTSVASVPNFYGMLSENNTYAMYYPSPNFTILPPNGTGLTFNANTYNGICIDGGTVSDNHVWNSIAYDYVLLGNVFVAKTGSTSRLTIEPGNTVKTVAGAFLQIGTYTGYPGQGGELYAIGTADSMITFTSYNGAIGGWEGIYFNNYNDNWGGVSIMDYCVIENGNDYNMLCDQSTQPSISNSIISDAVTDGLRFNDSYGSVTNSDLYNFGRYPIYFTDWRASPTLTGNTYASKGINLIALEAGDYTEDRTLQNDGIDYLVLNNIRVRQNSSSNPRLTIEAGLTINFASGTYLQIGSYDVYPGQGGELYAVGSPGNEITFKPFSDIAGDWEGIYFHEYNDNWSGTSSMEYCIVDKGNEYNLYIEQSGQPTIESCVFSDAAQYGIKEYNAWSQIHNSQFLNNGSYPLYYSDWSCNSHLSGNTYSGNNPNLIALEGGDYTDNRTLYNDGIEYHILNTIRVLYTGNFRTLTIEPGITMNFEPGTRLQIGAYDGYPGQGGALLAEGNADSVITFKPYNDLAGGWDGIYFHDHSDSWSAVSSMKFCKIEKGSTYNIYFESTIQPATFENCDVVDAVGYGMSFYDASPSISSSSVTNNGDYGIYLNGTSNPEIGNDPAKTCNIFGNGPFEIYNNTANNINARYNYWGTGDSAMIASRIYDYYDNTTKGIVIFGDFAQVPSVATTQTIMSGNIWYNNTASTAMDNAAIDIYDFGSALIASTTTNGSGYYNFSAFTSGNYTMDVSPSNLWGGANSTDALMILNHFAHLDTLKGMELAAADVNQSQTVNGTDAMFVMKRYATMISSFPAGDWLYHTENLTVNGNTVVNDMAMLCFGDVNASYTPAKKEEGSVFMVYEGNQVIQSFEEFTVLVSVKDVIEAGAISLGLSYPEEFMEINDVQLVNANGNLIFNTNSGLLRLAWADLNALNYNAGDQMLILTCTAKDLSSLTNPIQLSIFDNSEIADPDATVYSSVTLSTPGLTTLAVGIDLQSNSGLWMSENFPNPFRNSTTIRYQLPSDGQVSLIVYDLKGNIVAVLVNEKQQIGEYTVTLGSDGLESGIYLYKLEFSANGDVRTLINKMSITR